MKVYVNRKNALWGKFEAVSAISEYNLCFSLSRYKLADCSFLLVFCNSFVHSLARAHTRAYDNINIAHLVIGQTRITKTKNMTKVLTKPNAWSKKSNG